MSRPDFEQLWREFPKTLPEFEAKFPDEAACRAYWKQIRFGDTVTCVRCGHGKTDERRDGWFECPKCHHQSRLTAGTIFQGTGKPLKLWFLAIWEVCVHRHGVSAKDLQRILGFGSYETAWTWLHKLRRGLVDQDRKPLRGEVEIDEGFIRGTRGACRGGKSVVLVAAERGGRIRLRRVANNDEPSIGCFADELIDTQARVISDGLASYNRRTLKDRAHAMIVQTKAEKAIRDAQQQCHWAISNLKRWWLATHHGAIFRQACAGLPRRIHLPLQPAQDPGCWPARRPGTPVSRRDATHDHAPARPWVCRPSGGVKRIAMVHVIR